MFFKCPKCGEELINSGWICSNCKTDVSKIANVEHKDNFLNLKMEDYYPEYTDEPIVESSVRVSY